MKPTKKESRGRPIDNDTPVLIYTQTFTDIKGEKYIWKWDKTKVSNGPLSVELFEPQYDKADKLQREIDSIERLYEPIKGERKKRITKVDKDKIEYLQKELLDFHYSFYPEERPIIKIRKNAKIKKIKI